MHLCSGVLCCELWLTSQLKISERRFLLTNETNGLSDHVLIFVWHLYMVGFFFFPPFFFSQVCKRPNVWELLFARQQDCPVPVQRFHIPKSLPTVQSISVQQIQILFPTLPGLPVERQKKRKLQQWRHHYYYCPQIITAPVMLLLTITLSWSLIYVISVLCVCYQFLKIHMILGGVNLKVF